MSEREALQRSTGRRLRAWVVVAAVLATIPGLVEVLAPQRDAGMRTSFAEPASQRLAPGYVGSDACASCHEKEYREWWESLHSKMEQPATAGTIRGSFTPDGTIVALAGGRRLAMIANEGRFFVEAPDSAGSQRLYPVERTVGNRHKQRYLTRFPDGSWRALPVQWNASDGRFVEWGHLASGKPGSGGFWADDAWQWQLKCAGCHTTGLDLGYEPSSKTYRTRWKDLAIGCEACHGPGEVHVDAKGGRENIVCPSRLPRARQDDVCGKCHSRGTAGPEEGAPGGLPGRIAYPYNMIPGAVLDEHFVQVTPERNPGDYWGDGSSKNHHQQLTDWRNSVMHRHGGDRAPSCTTCHEPHRASELRGSIEDNGLCITCHDALGSSEALAAHSGHGGDPLANPGARCVECHMPRIVEHAGSFKLRSHTFHGADPLRSRETGTPDACLICHQDRDATWSLDASRKIWPALGDRDPSSR